MLLGIQRSLRKAGFQGAYLRPVESHELRPLDPEGGEMHAVLGLMKDVFPASPHFTQAVLHWQYVGNPVGAAVGYNAWSGGSLAAHYATMPMQAMVGGHLEKGLLSLNTGTSPAHQGQGLFTRLAQATYEKAAVTGHGFVLGVAKAAGTPGFLRKLGFQLVAPLPAMVGLGALPRKEVQARTELAPVHDEAFLAWRLRHPVYRYAQWRSGGRAFVLSARRQFGARYVMDELEAPLAEGILPQESRAVPAKLWIGLEPGMRWKGSAYVNVPMRWRPSPLNLIFKDLSGQGRKLDARAVRFGTLDFDVL